MFKFVTMLSRPLTWGLGKAANLADRASIWSEKSPSKSGSLVGLAAALGAVGGEFYGFDAANVHTLGGWFVKLGGWLQAM
mgnify:FL=1